MRLSMMSHTQSDRIDDVPRNRQETAQGEVEVRCNDTKICVPARAKHFASAPDEKHLGHALQVRLLVPKMASYPIKQIIACNHCLDKR